jgi:hypothetical protein
MVPRPVAPRTGIAAWNFNSSAGRRRNSFGRHNLSKVIVPERATSPTPSSVPRMQEYLGRYR